MFKHLLFAILIPIIPVAAEELAIVRVEEGSLLDDDGNVVNSVSLFDTLQIEGRDYDQLRVRRHGQLLWIHRGAVHRTSQFNDARPESLDGLREVCNLLKVANEQSTQNRHKEAISSAKQAAIVARRTFGKASTWEMWVLQFQATAMLKAGLVEDAGGMLSRCVSLMEELDAGDHIHSADVFNSIGNWKVAVGDTQSAITAYRKATVISTRRLGAGHYDAARTQVNESRVQEVIGDLSQASQLQRLALVTLEKLVPSSTITLPESWNRLGGLQRDDGQLKAAARSFRKSAELYREHWPQLVAESVEASLGLVDCQIETGRLSSAEAVCSAILGLPDHLEEDDRLRLRQEVLSRLGRIETARDNFGAAIKRFSDATELTNRENPTSRDAITYRLLGDAHLKVASATAAVAAYEQAIELFASLEGSESDNVLDLRDHVYTHPAIPYSASDAYCVTAFPGAVMTDE